MWWRNITARKEQYLEQEQLPAYEFEQKHLQRLASRLSLSAEEHKEFYDDLLLLLKKWEGKR